MAQNCAVACGGVVALQDALAPEESARRIRVAVAYSGREQKDIAEAVGINPDTFRNYVSVTRPTRLDLDRRKTVAIECGVPPAFMEYGFAIPTESDDELRATVRRLEAQVGRLQAEVGVLVVEARRQNERAAQTTKHLPRKRPA